MDKGTAGLSHGAAVQAVVCCIMTMTIYVIVQCHDIVDNILVYNN